MQSVRVLVPALVAELCLCAFLIRHDPEAGYSSNTAGTGAFPSCRECRSTLKSLIGQWEQLVSENTVLDAQLSNQCLALRSCGDGLAVHHVWEAQTVAALDRSIASVSVAMDAYGQEGHRSVDRALHRLLQHGVHSLDDRHQRLLGSHSRHVWDLMVPTLDEAAKKAGWLGNGKAPTEDASSTRGFSLLDSSTGQDIAEAAADRYGSLATIVSIPASTDELGNITANSSSTIGGGGGGVGSEFPRVLHCSNAATVHLFRGLYLSPELFAVHWAGEWPSAERFAREGSAMLPSDSDQHEAAAVKQMTANSAGAGMPSPGQRLAIAMDTFVVVPLGELGWTGQAADQEHVQQNLKTIAAEVGASVVVTVIGGLADTSILVHVSLRKLHRRIQHHFIDPGPEARSPAEARVIHSRYTLVFDGDDIVNARRVVLNRLSDGSEIAFTGGRGVTVQSLAMLGLVASERHTLFRAISALQLYEDMAPWNLMVAHGAVEYVDSENRDRKLDQYLPVLGALSLYFQSFEEMAQLLGLCVGRLAGPTPYGKNVRALESKTLRLY